MKRYFAQKCIHSGAQYIDWKNNRAIGCSVGDVGTLVVTDKKGKVLSVLFDASCNDRLRDSEYINMTIGSEISNINLYWKWIEITEKEAFAELL